MLVLSALLPTAADVTSNVEHNRSFHFFASQLYCAGAEEQRCPDGSTAGSCYWYKSDRTSSGTRLTPVTAADINRSVPTSTFGACILGWDSGDSSKCAEPGQRAVRVPTLVEGVA